ncbi:MAG: YceI family protein [Xanthomonadales bacterium]|nr:YceI family protein [Xanthomonadales bacterium]
MTDMRRAAGLLCVLLAACQPQPVPDTSAPQPPPSQASADWPPVAYQADDAHTWRVQPGDSRVDLVVRRAGPLARFGHDHVLSTTAVEGWLRWNPEAPGSAHGDLRVAVAELDVDAPAARARHDVDGDPSADDIQDTRENLQREVLRAGQWPHVIVRLGPAERADGHWRVTTRVVLNGQAADYEVPVSIETDGRTLVAAGTFDVLQSRHGIEPFSVLGGSLSVADAVTVVFDLRAEGQP